ncbi:hypothetical protein ACQPYK_05285 [Streptosporangium sp. CA-135522]|uniref:hypothetical protein n=1 Tax=Streptosporangium sp. CA-135522 TaxID=3240072 RepID=UPI003D8A6D8C
MDRDVHHRRSGGPRRLTGTSRRPDRQAARREAKLYAERFDKAGDELGDDAPEVAGRAHRGMTSPGLIRLSGIRPRSDAGGMAARTS